MAEESADPGAGAGEQFDASGLPADRRLARGTRTRTALSEATIELINAGTAHPTAGQVADRAGVSVRQIFNHFGDVDELFRTAVQLHLDRHRSLVVAIPGRGPTRPRVETTCHHRRQLFEAVGPVLQSAYARAPDSPPLHDVLVRHQLGLRRQLAVTLGPEVSGRATPTSALLDTLDVTTGWLGWSGLRFAAGHSPSSAEQMMVRTVLLILR